MNLVTNGSFETGFIEPWVSLVDGPVTGKLKHYDGKNWYEVPGTGNVMQNAFRQKILLPQEDQGDWFTLDITTCAIPTGAGASNAGNDPERLTARLDFWLKLRFGEAQYTTGYAIVVSTTAITHSLAFQLVHSRPVTHAELDFAPYDRPNYDRADILVTGISLVQERKPGSTQPTIAIEPIIGGQNNQT